VLKKNNFHNISYFLLIALKWLQFGMLFFFKLDRIKLTRPWNIDNFFFFTDSYNYLIQLVMNMIWILSNPIKKLNSTLISRYIFILYKYTCRIFIFFWIRYNTYISQYSYKTHTIYIIFIILSFNIHTNFKYILLYCFSVQQ